MPCSMTGYGRFCLEDHNSNYTVTAEMRSVNHRFLDLSIHLPKNYSWLEADLIKILKLYFQRGKIDLYVSIENVADHNHWQLEFNRELLVGYLKNFKQIKNEFKLSGKIRMEQLLLIPELFVIKENIDEEAIKKAVLKAAQGAAEELLLMREKEGEIITSDLIKRITFLQETIGKIQELASGLPNLYREKLSQNIKEVLGEVEIDENRLATEVLFYVDRSSITEEIVRFKSHLEQFLSTLSTKGSIGRKLNFITQELHREANTIASKTVDLSISEYIVDIKTEIEKIREQVQNIE